MSDQQSDKGEAARSRPGRLNRSRRKVTAPTTFNPSRTVRNLGYRDDCREHGHHGWRPVRLCSREVFEQDGRDPCERRGYRANRGGPGVHAPAEPELLVELIARRLEEEIAHTRLVRRLHLNAPLPGAQSRCRPR